MGIVRITGKRIKHFHNSGIYELAKELQTMAHRVLDIRLSTMTSGNTMELACDCQPKVDCPYSATSLRGRLERAFVKFHRLGKGYHRCFFSSLVQCASPSTHEF
jgi:hypothetical protein